MDLLFIAAGLLSSQQNRQSRRRRRRRGYRCEGRWEQSGTQVKGESEDANLLICSSRHSMTAHVTSVFTPAANLFHPHSQKTNMASDRQKKTLPHRKTHLQVPVHDVMLVDVADALQDLIDAVAKRDRRTSVILGHHIFKTRLRRVPGICLAVVLSSNDVLKQLSSGDAADREKTPTYPQTHIPHWCLRTPSEIKDTSYL